MDKKRSRMVIPFIEILWNLVDDKSTNDVIAWAENKHDTFQIKDAEKLKTDVLKKFYASKWESFRRQLYFYGFKSSNKDEFWSHVQLDSTNKKKSLAIKRLRKRKVPRFDDSYPALREFYPKMFISDASILPPMLNPSLAKMMKSTPAFPGSSGMSLAPPLFTAPAMFPSGFEFPCQNIAPIFEFPPLKRPRIDVEE